MREFLCYKCKKVLFEFLGAIKIRIICPFCGSENRAGIGKKYDVEVREIGEPAKAAS